MKKSYFTFIFFLLFALFIYAKPKESNQYIYDPIFDSKVYVEEHGKKSSKSVILIHGLGDRGLKDWDNLIPILKNKFHVICFDLPGFGRSEKKNGLYSPILYTSFIKSLADKFIKGKYIVIGHSLGGALATVYSATYPNNIDKLVLIDVAGILQRTALSKHYSKTYLNKNTPAILSKPLNIIEEWADNAIDILQNVPFEFDLILGSKISRDAIFGGSSQGVAGVSLVDTDFTPFIKLIKIPTLILWGENDSITPKRVGNILNFMIPTSELDIIKETSHNPMLERSEYTNSRILNFITEKTKIKPSPRIKKIKSKKNINSLNENNKTYSGAYKTINITNSNGIILKDISADEIIIVNSSVTIENAIIDSKTTALNATNSKITITASQIVGKNILQAINSSLDIGGVYMTGKESSFFVDNSSTVIFSVCEINSPELKGYLHKVLK